MGQVVYQGSHTAVTVEGGIRAVRDEVTDVPDELEERLVTHHPDFVRPDQTADQPAVPEGPPAPIDVPQPEEE